MPVRSSAVTCQALRRAAGPRERKDRPRANHGEGRERRGCQALESNSDKPLVRDKERQGE